MRRLLPLLLVALVAVPAASAKDFKPGDLRLCGHAKCVAIKDAETLRGLSRLYSGTAPRVAQAPALGGAVLQLRFAGNNYVTGVISGGRFLSFGVNLDRLRAGVWYALPAHAASELARLALRLEPYQLTTTTLARSR